MKKLLTLILALVLVLSLSACTQTPAPTEPAATQPAATEPAASEVQFTFVVVDADGKETTFEISTNEETVGAALLAEGLIAGEESEYGLYVKTVNGITADYDVDMTYWAFYIDGEYAMTGVDATDIVPGSTYTFKVEGGQTDDSSAASVEFDFVVVDPDGKEKLFTIATEKKTVGEALLEVELIAGEMGDYGLYVKTVNGITLDYETDGMYWSFYINGEYAMTGVDQTEIVPGTTYMFKAEAA